MMTVLGLLTYLALKQKITKWIAKTWADIKKEAIKIDGFTLEGKLKKKKERKRKKK